MPFDRLATAVPVNRTAAVVTGRGEGHDVTLKADPQQHWTAPPPYTRPPSDVPDLVGNRFGRFVVLGYLGPGKRGSMWLCRCSCGDYESRVTKAVRNPNNADDSCRRCRRLEYVKRMGSSR